MKRTGRALIFYANGIIKSEKVPEDFSLSWAAERMGCEWIEIVRPKHLADNFVMLVDEEGLMKDRPMLNLFGSYVYETYIHGDPIVGNIIIMKEVPGPEGPELVGLTNDEADELADSYWKNANEWAELVTSMLRLRGVME